MPPDGDRSGDHAPRAGVQQGGHVPLVRGGRPSDGEVHRRQDLTPRATRPEPVLDGAASQAALERLTSRDDFVLRPQYAPELLAIVSGEGWHERNMSRGSDKTSRSVLVDGPLYQ